MHQLTLIHRYDGHEMLFLMHPQCSRTVLLHVAEGILHLVPVSVSVRSRLYRQKLPVSYIFPVHEAPYLAGFVAQLLFIGHSLIDAASADLTVSADIHISKPPVAVVEFFFVFEESVFFD